MNRINEEKLEMFIRVHKLLMKFSHDLSEDNRIEICVLELEERIKRIKELAIMMPEENMSPLMHQNDERKGLEHIMAKIAAAVRSYGLNTNDRTLQNKVNYSLHDIVYWRDSRLHFNALRLSEIADPLVNQLTEYKVDSSDLNNLVNETGAYFGRIQNEKTEFRPVLNPSMELSRQFRLTEYLLNRLDYWMEDFVDSNSGIWQEYCQQRISKSTKASG